MEMLSNSVSTVIQLWKLINLRTSEDWYDAFSKTSVKASTARYKGQEDIFNTLLSPQKNIKTNHVMKNIGVQMIIYQYLRNYLQPKRCFYVSVEILLRNLVLSVNRGNLLSCSHSTFPVVPSTFLLCSGEILSLDHHQNCWVFAEKWAEMRV
jgi:hypothetical protein